MFPYAKQWKTAHTVGSLCSVAARYNVKMIQFDTCTSIIPCHFQDQGNGRKG